MEFTPTQEADVSTDEMFFALVDLIGREYVSRADYTRIGRLGKILAARMGMTRESVFEAARAELAVA